MSTLVSFGSVIKYNDEPYVFLAGTPETVYLAKILDKPTTSWLKSVCDSRIISNRDTRRNPLFCYVILKTSEFRDQAASLARTGNSAVELTRYFDKLICVLEETDLQAIKNEILQSRAVPGELKSLLASIDLN